MQLDCLALKVQLLTHHSIDHKWQKLCFNLQLTVKSVHLVCDVRNQWKMPITVLSPTNTLKLLNSFCSSIDPFSGSCYSKHWVLGIVLPVFVVTVRGRPFCFNNTSTHKARSIKRNSSLSLLRNTQMAYMVLWPPPHQTPLGWTVPAPGFIIQHRCLTSLMLLWLEERKSLQPG